MVVARRYSELVAWQLASQLRSEINCLTQGSGFERNRWLQDQLRSASHSACANIAEGFSRFYPRDFARFVRIAKGSLEETKEHLKQATSLGLVSAEETRRLGNLADQACGAAVGLIRYLQTARPPQQ